MQYSIRSFHSQDKAVLASIITGYVSDEKYAVTWQDSEETSAFTLTHVRLAQPYIKHFELEDDAYYHMILSPGLSVAAYQDDTPVALALMIVEEWNRTLWLYEFHVMAAHRGKGIGRQMMDAVKQQAIAQDCRTIVCETQNTNMPAIRFYRRMGFRIEAIDISLYNNDDYPDQEIAIFMKCPVVSPSTAG